jgi:hypothetical protein
MFRATEVYTLAFCSHCENLNFLPSRGERGRGLGNNSFALLCCYFTAKSLARTA